MLECWEAALDNRPSFEELYKDISRYTERIAGYLELEYSPFSGVDSEAAINESGPKTEEGETESVGLIHVIESSLNTAVEYADSTLNSNSD